MVIVILQYKGFAEPARWPEPAYQLYPGTIDLGRLAGTLSASCRFLDRVFAKVDAPSLNLVRV